MSTSVIYLCNLMKVLDNLQQIIYRGGIPTHSLSTLYHATLMDYILDKDTLDDATRITTNVRGLSNDPYMCDTKLNESMDAVMDYYARIEGTLNVELTDIWNLPQQLIKVIHNE